MINNFFFGFIPSLICKQLLKFQDHAVFVRTNVIKNLQLYYLATITENFIETVKSYKLSNCSLVSFFIFLC